MKRETKRKKYLEGGITLIALVVTIVILIVLAMIAIKVDCQHFFVQFL